MSVEFTAYAGISIVNAIPALKGVVAAIDLPARVRAYYGECKAEGLIGFILNELGVKGVCVEVESRIPPKSGLKSNSAIATAVIYAVRRLIGEPITPLEAARLAAVLTKRHGSSITGAFDDASASALGGVVFTDNGKLEILKHDVLTGDYIVVIAGYKDEKRLENLERLRRLSGIFAEIFEMAFNGDLWRAAVLNGLLVAESLGYYKAIKAIGKALSLGALACGVSGNGPTIYAVFKKGEEGVFVDYVEEEWGYHMEVEFVPPRNSYKDMQA